jgi:hypothetical protein
MHAHTIVNHTVHAEHVACTDGSQHDVAAFHTVHAPPGTAFDIQGDLAHRTAVTQAGPTAVANVFGTPHAAAAHTSRLQAGNTPVAAPPTDTDAEKYVGIMHVVLFALLFSAVSWFASAMLGIFVLPRMLRRGGPRRGE